MDNIVKAEASLYELVDMAGTQQLFTNYRASLIRISHEIENGILSGAVSTRIYAGFQKLSFFLPHQQRYRQMMALAESIWVFGVPDVAPPEIPGIHYILLNEQDLLTQEWFLVAEGQNYFSALVAKDLSGFNVPNHQRLFTGIWTFDEAVVAQLQHWLSHLVRISPLEYQPAQRNYENQIFCVSRIAGDLIRSLEQRNEELQTLQKLRDQLLDMVVHDLRGPLDGTMNYLDQIETAIQQRGDSEEILELLERARIGNTQLNTLIDIILDLNRMAAGEFSVKKELVTLAPLFEELQAEFLATARFYENTLEIALASPDLTVAADRNILIRVLSTLLSNSIRYMQQGNVQLVAKRDKKKGHTLISIVDNGEGIPPNELASVFDIYFQGESQRIKGGAGLGLVFCKYAVEAMGGTVVVESKIGKGSTFHISLSRV